MGCDIHFYVEKREDGKWESADKWEMLIPWMSDEPYLGVNNQIYNDRNYELFAILAGVRQEGDDPLNYICEPKGLPFNGPNAVSENVINTAKGWGDDGHSHSWFTVTELMEFDWTQTKTQTGILNVQDYYEWKNMVATYYPDVYPKESPSRSYVESVDGASFIDEDKLQILLKFHTVDDCNVSDILKETLPNTFVEYSWNVPYFDLAENFISKTMPKLWRIGKPDDVRIVFWFDN